VKRRQALVETNLPRNIRINAGEFDSFRMWIWPKKKVIVRDTAVRSIIDREVEKPNFIFMGKAVPMDSIDFTDLAKTFDQLLPLYYFVETQSDGGGIPRALLTAIQATS
jgi:hypothetical protein